MDLTFLTGKRNSSGNPIQQIVSGSNIGTREQNQELNNFWNTKYKSQKQDETEIRNAIVRGEMVMTYLEMDLYSKFTRNYATSQFAGQVKRYEDIYKHSDAIKNWPKDNQGNDNENMIYFVVRDKRLAYLNISDLICTQKKFNEFIDSNRNLNLTYFRKWLIVMGYIDTNSNNPVTNQEKCIKDFDTTTKYYFKKQSAGMFNKTYDRFNINKRPFYKAQEGIKFYYPVDGETYTLVRSPVLSNEGQPHISTEHQPSFISGDRKETSLPTKSLRTEVAILNQSSDIGLGRANIFKSTAPTCYFRFVKDDELEVLSNRGGRKTKRKSKKAKKKSRKQKKRLVRKTRNKRSKRTRKH